MTKQEFDNLSKAAGFGPCADFMWPEIEEVYSTAAAKSRARNRKEA